MRNKGSLNSHILSTYPLLFAGNIQFRATELERLGYRMKEINKILMIRSITFVFNNVTRNVVINNLRELKSTIEMRCISSYDEIKIFIYWNLYGVFAINCLVFWWTIFFKVMEKEELECFFLWIIIQSEKKIVVHPKEKCLAFNGTEII